MALRASDSKVLDVGAGGELRNENVLVRLEVGPHADGRAAGHRQGGVDDARRRVLLGRERGVGETGARQRDLAEPESAGQRGVARSH